MLGQGWGLPGVTYGRVWALPTDHPGNGDGVEGGTLLSPIAVIQ